MQRTPSKGPGLSIATIPASLCQKEASQPRTGVTMILHSHQTAKSPICANKTAKEPHITALGVHVNQWPLCPRLILQPTESGACFLLILGLFCLVPAYMHCITACWAHTYLPKVCKIHRSNYGVAQRRQNKHCKVEVLLWWLGGDLCLIAPLEPRLIIVASIY